MVYQTMSQPPQTPLSVNSHVSRPCLHHVYPRLTIQYIILSSCLDTMGGQNLTPSQYYLCKLSKDNNMTRTSYIRPRSPLPGLGSAQGMSISPCSYVQPASSPCSDVQPASTRDLAIRAHALGDGACSCAEHSPELYDFTSCAKFLHHCIIRQHGHDTRDYRPIRGKPYEPLHLVHEAIVSFSQDRLNMCRTQQMALADWLELIQDPQSALRKLGWADGPRALASTDVLPILSIFNDVFFFGALDQIDFKWADLGDGVFGAITEGRLINLSSTTTGNLEPTTEQTIYQARMVDRLGTLLHECAHAYLGQFACQHCIMYTENVENAGKHGRAFQRIVTALENVSETLFGVKLSVSGSSDFLKNWGKVRYLPSMHDMAEWNWFLED
jgi:hypothetical protein